MSLTPIFRHIFTTGTLLKSLLFLVLAVTLAACGGDEDYFRSPCLPTEDEKQAQKVVDIKVIKKFLRENKVDTTNMQVTASGIHYFVTKQGTGAQVTAGKKVEVEYIGKHLCAGFPPECTFDNSYPRPEPFWVNVGARQVIAGWEEALQLMKVGEDTRFYIPSYLAYGPCGSSGAIGPNEVLVFDIAVLRMQ